MSEWVEISEDLSLNRGTYYKISKSKVSHSVAAMFELPFYSGERNVT